MRKAMRDRSPSGKGWFGLTLGVLMGATMASAPANAEPMTYVIEFSAHSFEIGSGGIDVPVDPVFGKVTLTFDPTEEVTNATANITLDSLNIVLGSSIAFSFDPASSDGFLTIGGINAGANIVIFDPSTDDFWLFIDNFNTTPTFFQMGYSQTSVSRDNLYFTLQSERSGSVALTVVPEPSSWVLAGMGSVGLVLRRRFARSRPREG